MIFKFQAFFVTGIGKFVFAPLFVTENGVHLEYFVFLTCKGCTDKNIKMYTRTSIEDSLIRLGFTDIDVYGCPVCLIKLPKNINEKSNIF